MKRSSIFFLSILIICLILFTGCSVPDKDMLGTYTCVDVSMDGESFDCEALYPEGLSFELTGFGQAWLNIGGERLYSRWSLEGESFTLDTGGEISRGTMSDGVCVLTFSDKGLVHTFTLPGVKPPLAEEEDGPKSEPLSDVQSFWTGDWYGTWTISNAEGSWLDQNGQSFDCFARFEVFSDNTGTVVFWDELQSCSEPLAKVDILISESVKKGGSPSLVSTGGYFLNMELEGGLWSLEPDNCPYDSMFLIEDGRYEGEDGSFDYKIMLRPWGRTWEDVEAQEPAALPFYYHDWYLPALSEGESMPDEFGFEQHTVIVDRWQEPEEEMPR